MKIEKLISVRVYDGKKTLHSALKTFLQAIRGHADWQTRFFWKEQAILDKLTKGTCLMILLGDEICGLVDYHVQPLKTTKHPANFHPLDSIWLSDFIIHPHYRKLGLGRNLLDITANYSRYLNKKKLHIEISDAKNLGLKAFLENYGFQPAINLGHRNTIIYECQINLTSKAIEKPTQKEKLEMA